MYRLKISGNFFLILNDSDLTEYARYLAKNVTYQIYNELGANPKITFISLSGIRDLKNNNRNSFFLNSLKNESGISFTNLEDLKTFLDNALGKYSAGSTAIPTSDIFNGGFVDYNDDATATTPINFSASVLVDLPNDKNGSFTNEAYLPFGVSSIWDPVLNQFIFTELKLGDMIDIRLDIDVTTTSPNQNVKVDLYLGIGAGEYLIPFAANTYKNSGVQKINRFNGIYMGDLNTLNNPAKFRLISDGPGSLKVNGWYCKIIKKG